MTDKEYIGVTANQLARIASDLKSENAKLREQIHWLERGDVMHVLTDQEYIDQCERERLMQVSIDALDAENAKLRELVLCLLTCASNIDDTCDKCPVNGGAGIWKLEDFCDSLLDRVRELGIEITDD